MQAGRSSGAAAEAKQGALRDLARAAQHDRVTQTSAPRMIVLVGIPGSGKSTFARRLEQLNWKRVSQDDSGSRQACERQTVSHLLNGHHVVIDRCNFDKAQRQHWTEYAKVRESRVGVVVFATPLEECVSRVFARESHPTLPATEESRRVVYSMASQFVMPDRCEGFVFCRIIRNDSDFQKALEEIASSP